MTVSEPTESSAPNVPQAGAHGRRLPTAAIWVAVLSLLLWAFLFVLYRAVNTLVYVPIFVIGLAAGITGIVLAIRARRSGEGRGRMGTWALLSSFAALVADVVLIGIIAVGVISVSSINAVLLTGHGAEGTTATFADDVNTYVDREWATDGWARFNTKESSTEITLNAPADSASQTVSCQIHWNDKLVVEETSDTGTVTCHYDAP